MFRMASDSCGHTQPTSKWSSATEARLLTAASLCLSLGGSSEAKGIRSGRVTVQYADTEKFNYPSLLSAVCINRPQLTQHDFGIELQQALIAAA